MPAAIPCSFATELLEIRSKEPSLNVLLIPGNPGPCATALMVQARDRIRNVEILLSTSSFCFVGISAFYKEYIEALYENLGGQASVTGNRRMHFFFPYRYGLVSVSFAAC